MKITDIGLCIKKPGGGVSFLIYLVMALYGKKKGFNRHDRMLETAKR